MLAKKLAFLLAASVTALMGCVAESAEEDGDEDFEEEPVGQSSDELRSAVSCQERTDVAYARGVAREIKVINIGGKPVSKPTGHAFLKMQAAADKAGVRLSLTSGFRTNDEQTRLYNCYLSKKCNHGNLAAPPRFSHHQNGLALDLSRSSWLARNAGKFGFVRTVSSEAWHYEYRGADPGGPCSRGEVTSPLPTDPTGGDESDDNGEANASLAGGISWVAPAQDSSVKNGFTVKAHANKPAIVKVVYSQGTFQFGTSTDAEKDFALNYTFQYMGEKTLTVKGYDASGALLAMDHVDFTLLP